MLSNLRTIRHQRRRINANLIQAPFGNKRWFCDNLIFPDSSIPSIQARISFADGSFKTTRMSIKGDGCARLQSKDLRQTSEPIAQAATLYHGNGLNVFPLIQRTKEPAIEWEKVHHLQERLASEKEIQAWFTENPNSNIGIVCGKVSGGLVILDFEDEDDYVSFFENTAKIESTTLVVSTPHGGRQVYFRVDNPPRRRTKIVGTEHPFDILGEGGYAAAPPSVIGHELCKNKEKCKLNSDGRYEIVSATRDILHLRNEDIMSTVMKRCKEIGWTTDTEFRRSNSSAESFQEIFIAELTSNALIRDLYGGNWRKHLPHKTRSEAEYLLVFELVRLGFPDSEICSIMETSKIGKWREKTRSYQDLTIGKARQAYVKEMQTLRKKASQSTNHPSEDERLDSEDNSNEETEIADQITDEMHVATLVENDQILHYKDGKYQRLGEAKVQQRIEQLVPTATNHKVQEILGHIRRRSYRAAEDFDADENILNLKNFMLLLASHQTLAHGPQYLSMQQIPVEYKPTAHCPTIWKAIKEILPDKKDRDRLLDFFAVCLWRTRYIKHALMLVGDTDSGKTTLVGILVALLGEDNVSYVPLQAIETDKFAASQLLFKFANIADDIKKDELRTTGLFKQLTGGLLVSAQFKYGHPFSFVPVAKHIYTANQLPNVHDDSLAFFNRWILIKCGQRFVDDPAMLDKDKPEIRLKDKGMREKVKDPRELSGLLNILLPRLGRIIQNKGLIDVPSAEDTKQAWMESVDPAIKFLGEAVMQDQQGEIVARELYVSYTTWAAKLGFTPHEAGEFNGFVRKKFGVGKDDTTRSRKHVEIWRGIKLKDGYSAQKVPSAPSFLRTLGTESDQYEEDKVRSNRKDQGKRSSRSFLTDSSLSRFKFWNEKMASKDEEAS